MIKKPFLLFALAFLSGCSTMNVTDYKNTEPTLLLEEYFVGETMAYGIFEDRSGNVTNQFKVKITGTFEDNILTLDEDFVYMDGKVDKRLWKIKKLPNGYYEGYAEGVVGLAKGQASGNAFNWTYVFDLPVGNKRYNIKFDDWMFLQDDGVLINRAYMTKWGFNVGSVTLAFHKKH